MTLLDQPAAVASIVAAESTWEPQWRRVATTAGMLAVPVLLAVGAAGPSAAAVAAVGATLLSRLVPVAAARRLRRDGRRVTVRSARQASLTTYAGSGLLALGCLPRVAGDGWATGAALTAAALILLQHRPAARGPLLAIACEGAESLALLGIFPLLTMATQGWWQ